jgi:hypothetical protein
MTKVLDRFINEGWVSGETPTGTVNGSNTSFTLAFTPDDPAGVRVFLDGLRETAFSLSGTTITMTTAPATGQSLTVDYTKKL